MEELRRLYLAGETEAALAVAESVRPDPMPPSLDAIPLVDMTADELMELPLDPRSAFLLARIDGVSDLKTILDISAMPHEHAMGLLERLIGFGAVRMLAPTTDKATLS